jgi:outer membrane protein
MRSGGSVFALLRWRLKEQAAVFSRQLELVEQGFRFMKRTQSYLAILCVLLTAAPWTYAQQTGPAPSDKNNGFKSHFGGFFKRYEAVDLPPVNVSNSSRLEALVRAGKLYLSLQDAIAASLENNIDIEVQRYAPRIAEADVLRAKAGGFIRGISTNVAGGSNGATGSGVTGTTGAATTAGTNSTTNANSGPLGYSLDPVLTGNLQWGHFSSPQSSTFLSGTNTLTQGQKMANFSVAQGFLTGTTASLGFNNNILSSNSLRNDFNPITSANAELYVSQHLLQGFGLAVNNRNIRIAKNNIAVADLVFKQQVENTVGNVISLYWDLVAFNEDVAVKRQALALAQKLYNDNKKQVEIGTLAPIEIVRAEAEVAAREQDLTTSETNVLQQETIIKNAISRNGVASPTIAEVRIVPMDRIRMPDVEPIQPVQDLTSKALDSRPELAESRIQLENSQIALKGTKNGLLPTLDGFVDLRNRGQAGALSSFPVLDPLTGSLIPRAPTSVNDYFLGGYGTALGQLFGRNFPDYSAGFQLNIPLRNRAAQADYTTAQLNLRQNQLQLQRQINNVRVDVQNALIALQQARARYKAAEKSQALQVQTLDAEQKKYALGASTVYLVIQAQRDLATAESTRVAALSAYARARTQLDLATGTTLETNNIQIEEAVKGSVSRPPSPIPAVEPQGGRAAVQIGTPLQVALPTQPAK